MGAAAANKANRLQEVVPENFVPQTPEDWQWALSDPMWRITNLYFISTKGDDEDEGEGLVVKFKPNRAQRRLLKRLWYRNLILKARQLGMTTLVCILFLDWSLFGPGHTRAGIIAHTDGDAQTLFRDKVKFAYDMLPQALKDQMPLERDHARELMFAHNKSSIRVATSMRSGTIHYLHISEFGKICAWFAKRAREIMTGTIPAVPKSGMIFVESTAEGRDGDFYTMTKRSEALAEAGKKLTIKDYRFHFFAWWQMPEYEMDPAGVLITDADHDYFDAIEAKAGTELSLEQRAWYCATRDSDFNGADERMWQEYPSIPEEAFQVSSEGCYFTKQFTAARKDGRMVEGLPVLPGVPCWTFWDIGNSDGTAIWVVQKVGTQFRLIRFYEAWGEPYSHAAQWLQGLGLTYEGHYLPHDAAHERQGKDSNKSPQMMLAELMPGHRFHIIDRIEDVNWGIQQTRDLFPMLVFDEGQCKPGIIHLEAYRKRWSEQLMTWSDSPDKAGGHSEAADALRQLGQAYASGMLNVFRSKTKPRKPRSYKTV